MWKSPIPSALLTMFMKKNSNLTPFMAYQAIRAQESGFKDISYMRNRIPEPNCKPIRIPTPSFGAQKATFLLLLLILGYAVAVLIFGAENVWVKKDNHINNDGIA